MAIQPRLQPSYRRVLDHSFNMAGIEISFTNPQTSTAESLTVIDWTKGIEVQDRGLNVPTISPAAAAKTSDITALGLTPAQMVGVTFALNGRNWRVKTTKPKPGPFGDESSQTFLILLQV